MIYSFQGAERSNFQRFRQFFEQRGSAPRLLQLKVNYRSVGAIVQASNLVANHRCDGANPAGHVHLQKQMVSGLDNSVGGSVTANGAVIRVVECSSDRDAVFKYLGTHISSLLSEATQHSKIGKTLGNIAVLYRQNATGKELRKYLKSNFPHIRTKQQKVDTEGTLLSLYFYFKRFLLINMNMNVDITDIKNQFERVTRLTMAWLRVAVDTSENASCAICLEDFEHSLGGKRRSSVSSTQGEMSILQRAQDFFAAGRASSLFEATRAVLRDYQSSIAMQSPTTKKHKSTGTSDNALFQAAINKLHKLESLHDRIVANEETLPRKYLHDTSINLLVVW
jgi:superfamily I DNA/RNA helicase